MILREYGWLARQHYAAVTRLVEMDSGQSSQPFRGAYVPAGNLALDCIISNGASCGLMVYYRSGVFCLLRVATDISL